MSTFTLENVAQIWNNKFGNRIEVGPDRDGLGMIEIRSYSDKNDLEASITMTEAEAKLVARAITTRVSPVTIEG